METLIQTIFGKLGITDIFLLFIWITLMQMNSKLDDINSNLDGVNSNLGSVHSNLDNIRDKLYDLTLGR